MFCSDNSNHSVSDLSLNLFTSKYLLRQLKFWLGLGFFVVLFISLSVCFLSSKKLKIRNHLIDTDQREACRWLFTESSVWDKLTGGLEVAMEVPCQWRCSGLQMWMLKLCFLGVASVYCVWISLCYTTFMHFLRTLIRCYLKMKFVHIHFHR